MLEEITWLIVYPNEDTSRSFNTLNEAISYLASLRNLEPNIKHIINSKSEVISKHLVWEKIKKMYDDGYNP